MSGPSFRSGISRVELVVAAVVVLLLAAALIPAVRQARETARRQQSRNLLRQIGHGFHNYHEAYNILPPGGTFAADGTPYHSWTLRLLPFIASTPFYNQIDMQVPWDHPWNRQFFQEAEVYEPCGQTDPGVSPQRTAPGHPAIHFAPNRRLLHRNSAVRFQDVPHTSQTLLASEAFGDFASFGDPIHWRDATLPFRTSTAGFGHVDRTDGTHVLYVDGGVEFVSNALDLLVSSRLAGADVPEPEPHRTAPRSTPYVSPADPPWTHFSMDRGGSKQRARFALSPDKMRLKVVLESERVRDEDLAAWLPRFQTLVRGAAVETVEIRGTIDAGELAPFVDLPSIRVLDLQRARVVGDATAVLGGKPGLTVLRSGG